MYLNFSNLQGQTSAGGGGQALVQKWGQVSDGGEDWQNFRWMGGPPARLCPGFRDKCSDQPRGEICKVKNKSLKWGT